MAGKKCTQYGLFESFGTVPSDLYAVLMCAFRWRGVLARSAL